MNLQEFFVFRPQLFKLRWILPDHHCMATVLCYLAAASIRFPM